MAKVDVAGLYRLQDRVFEAVFSVETTLYVTGGTCLNRFYLHCRDSEDIDFFTSENTLFRDDLRKARETLVFRNIPFSVVVDTRDFQRLLVEDSLQVDFVNDRVPRIGSPAVMPDRTRIDTIENICANKLSAIMGRDEPKDVFDLYVAARAARFDWSAVLRGADRKTPIRTEELEYRLRSFPFELLSTLAVTRGEFLQEMRADYPRLVEDIVSGARNGLYR